MPLPNLNNPTKVEGKNIIISNIPTVASGYLINPIGSNKTFRISNIYISNIDGTSVSDVSCYIVNNNVSASGYLAYKISVPADATLLTLTKDSNSYLMENQTLFLQASSSGDLSAVINYEDIT